MLLHLTIPDHTPIAINPAAVISVHPRPDAAAVWLTSSSIPVAVAEPYAEVCARLEAALGGERAYVGPTGPDADRTACTRHECGYYRHYLVYGGPDLTHEGYHAAEEQASKHMERCERDWAKTGPCQQCLNWEQRVRA